MSNTGFTVTVHGDLSKIFKARTSAAGLATHFIASDSRDLNDWFELSTSGSDQITYDTTYICGAYGDLKNAFMDINYNPTPYTATGTYSKINVGNDYAIQFTGTSGTINFNIGGIYVNYLVIGGGGAGEGKSTIVTSSIKKKGGGGASETNGNFTCVQNSDYTISVGTGGVGGEIDSGLPGNGSSITNNSQSINITANGGGGGSGHAGNNDTTYPINYNSITLTYSYGNPGFDGGDVISNSSTRGAGGGVNAGAGSGLNGGKGGSKDVVQTFANNATMSFGNGGGACGFNHNPIASDGNGGSGSQGVVVLWFTYPPIYTTTGTFQELKIGNTWVVQFTDSGTITFNIPNISVNYLLIGSGGSGGNGGRSALQNNGGGGGGGGGGLYTSSQPFTPNKSQSYPISVSTSLNSSSSFNNSTVGNGSNGNTGAGAGGTGAGGSGGTGSQPGAVGGQGGSPNNGDSGGAGGNNVPPHRVSVGNISLNYAVGTGGGGGGGAFNGTGGVGGYNDTVASGADGGAGGGFDNGDDGNPPNPNNITNPINNNTTFYFGNGGGGGGGCSAGDGGSGVSGSPGCVVIWFQYP
uniref:Glycine-rich domain-containing protein n=1 Tax=viral metagenome TaxID=1070528 RepID=A0A6C0JYJ9_9ZZZZ